MELLGIIFACLAGATIFMMAIASQSTPFTLLELSIILAACIVGTAICVLGLAQYENK